MRRLVARLLVPDHDPCAAATGGSLGLTKWATWIHAFYDPYIFPVLPLLQNELIGA
jgi:hypothetical protein